MEKCCCLILNYNDADTVAKLVNCIIEYPSIDEILVVDNCSRDNSMELLKKIKQDKVILIQAEKNGGYGAGNNLGIKYALNERKCKYVLLSNPDVLFSNTLVIKMRKAFEKFSDAAIVTAVQYDINRVPIKDLAWKLPTSFDYALMTTGIGKRISNLQYSYDEISKNDYNEVDCVPGALLMYDAKKFCEVGGYDEKMFLYCEEDTIAYKLKNYAYKTILIGTDYYIHEHSVSIDKSISSKKIQSSMIFKNRIYFMKTYLKSSFVWILIARLLQKRRLFKMK